MRDRPICAIDRWRCAVDGSTICASIDRSRSHRWIALRYRQMYCGAFDIVKGIHVDELKHSGYKIVMDYVQRHYHGITRGFIQEYCKHCPACQLSQPQVTRPPLRPIITRDFLERVQVDLIDVRHSPDQDYHYIGHFMDHFSKYHVLFPLKQKEWSINCYILQLETKQCCNFVNGAHCSLMIYLVPSHCTASTHAY